jgi:hypothetical protein
LVELLLGLKELFATLPVTLWHPLRFNQLSFSLSLDSAMAKCGAMSSEAMSGEAMGGEAMLDDAAGGGAMSAGEAAVGCGATSGEAKLWDRQSSAQDSRLQRVR